MTVTAKDYELQPANVITNFIDIIASPGQALQRISRVNTRSWLFPALLSLAGALLYLWVTLDEQIALATKQMEIQLGAMSPDQVEAARPMMERFMQPGVLFGSSAATTALGLVVGWLFATAILYFGAAILGGQPKMANLWPALVWTWIPFALRGFLQTIWAAVNNAMIIYPGLAYFVASGDTTADQKNPLFIAAAQADLFALWHLVLIYVLLRVIARLGGAGAFVLTLVYAAINVGVRLLPVVIASAFSLS